MEPMTDYKETTELPRRDDRAENWFRQIKEIAKLANCIRELTEMLSDRLWDDPAYGDIKDRLTLLALIDATKAVASELEEMILEQ